MKLPQEPKERMKVLMLIGIGAVAVVFMVVSVVVKPLMARKAQYREDIALAREDLDTAQRDVNRMMVDRDANTKVLEGIVDGAYRQNFVLEPRLGNYELGAREFVEGIAQSVGVTIASMREIGLTQMPLPTTEQDKGLALKCYNMNVQLLVGLPDLMLFLNAVEAGNPYLCVSSIAISSRIEDPALHTVVLELQWPVWAVPTLGRQLEQRLQDSHTLSLTPAPPT